MENRIKAILMELGADVCGIAGVERFADAPSGFHPTDLYSDCKSVIVFAKRMPKGLAFVNPRILYIHATDINLAELDRISFLASVEIEKLGGVAVPVPSDSPYDDWDADTLKGRGILSMRHAAVLTGLGTLGKNTLLLNKTYGNMLNIGAVLTNLELSSDPLAETICIENCRRCLDACPQNALDGTSVTQKPCREFTYSKNSKGITVCNCNKCRVVCPRAFGIPERSKL